MSIVVEQKKICTTYSSEWVESPLNLKVGIAKNVKDGVLPIHGLRHAPEGDTTGWYIWAGEELSSDDDFFEPLHVSHLEEWCKEVLPYLGLAPGYRFLLAPEQEDVWFDESLI